MLKEIGEGIAFVFLAGAMVTMYTMVACVANEEPFPAWFAAAWYLYCSMAVIALVGLVGCVVRYLCVRRHRRLGMIRYDSDRGRYYYER